MISTNKLSEPAPPLPENSALIDFFDYPPFLELIQAWLSAGVLTKAGLEFRPQGLPQGAVISPLLANIYLDDFDEILAATDLKLVRYADDFVVMARSEKRIIQAQAEVAQILDSIGLQLGC